MQVTQTHSGLYVAEQSADYKAVQAALRQHDPTLRLVPQHSDEYDTIVWKVYADMGGDRPAVFVCGWWDRQLRPLPLSHALVDRVKQLDRNTVGRELDPDEHNTKLSAEQQARMDAAVDEAAAENERRRGRLPVLHRGAHLRRSSRRRYGDGSV